MAGKVRSVALFLTENREKKKNEEEDGGGAREGERLGFPGLSLGGNQRRRGFRGAVGAVVEWRTRKKVPLRCGLGQEREEDRWAAAGLAGGEERRPYWRGRREAWGEKEKRPDRGRGPRLGFC
jgi:hypothetical protein